MKRMLSDIIDVEAREFALYSIEERAIANLIDGFKPVQRLFVYSALKTAKNDFKKVAALGGVVSDYGYNHAEKAAQDAGVLISNNWNNNMPILQGRGNFGSRMVHDSAQSRYIFCKVHENFFKLYKDTNVAPVHKRPEFLPPAYYLPIIPTILLNGVKGIATGWATNILPHSVESVKACVNQVLLTGTCDEPTIQFPEFNGKIDTTGDKWFVEGLYEFTAKTHMLITEIPMKYDRESYVAVLDKLEEDGEIVSYIDECGKHNFQFKVVLKRSIADKLNANHNAVIKMFKLKQGISQNLTAIDQNSKVKSYEKTSDLIIDFVKCRMPFTQKRIDAKILETKADFLFAEAKVIFINKFIAGEFDSFKVMKKSQCIDEINNCMGLEGYGDKLIAMNIFHMTEDEVIKLQKEAAGIRKEHEYWLKTTAQKQFIKDIKDL